MDTSRRGFGVVPNLDLGDGDEFLKGNCDEIGRLYLLFLSVKLSGVLERSEPHVCVLPGIVDTVD